VAGQNFKNLSVAHGVVGTLRVTFGEKKFPPINFFEIYSILFDNFPAYLKI
jgi:hypothetical protein